MRNILSIIVLSIVFAACDTTPAEKRPENLNSESMSAGVVAHGFTSPGWIQNQNMFPVMIKQVWLFHGESTQWVKVFQPGEKQFQYINHQYGYHISSVGGNEIGWIKPERNGSSQPLKNKHGYRPTASSDDK